MTIRNATEMTRSTDTGTKPLFPDVGVISLVPETWGGMWLSRQQILTRLSRYFNVVWFDPPIGWRKLWMGPGGSITQPDAAPPPSQGFTVYPQSKWLPKFYKPRRLGEFTGRKRLDQARRLLEQQGCSKTIMYVWLPRFGHALDLVEHDVSCYHIADEYSFSSVERPVSAAETDLISRVDQVFIHSPALMEKKGHINPRTMYVTNGVDYPAFAAEMDEPEDLSRIPHPRVGYTGRIKVQMDWDVLAKLAAKHSDWSFVFVGPLGFMGDRRDKRDALFSRNNVYYLGNRSVAEIPAYTRHLDACMLCYDLNDYTKYIFPLKLHEYLASGRPVVGSALPSLEAFTSVVDIAHSDQEWSEMLTRALQPESCAPGRVEQRRAVARDYDWNTLVGRIARALCERLGTGYLETLDSADLDT